MGYEITFYYKEKDKETGEYNESGTFKKRVGDPYEDTPIENLASVILRQLARRDVFVENVEIFEITKKKINFKESKSGIVIKNKKFGLDDSFEVKAESEDAPTINNVVEIETFTNNAPRIPIRKMAYVPEPQQHIKLLKSGVKLTPNKSYDIFKIQKHPTIDTMEVYRIVDDNGKEKDVSDECFVPNAQLEADTNDFGLSDDGLNWNGAINTNIPSIR
jgi:hypothetical protein